MIAGTAPKLKETNLVERVFDGDDRVLRGEVLVQLAELLPGELLVAPLVLEVQVVTPVGHEELRGGNIHAHHHLFGCKTNKKMAKVLLYNATKRRKKRKKERNFEFLEWRENTAKKRIIRTQNTKDGRIWIRGIEFSHARRYDRQDIIVYRWFALFLVPCFAVLFTNFQFVFPVY